MPHLYHVYMNDKKSMGKAGTPKPTLPTKTNNDRLRELVARTNLTQAEALALFNRELGPAAYSLSAWQAFFVSQQSARSRPMKDTLLEHAEKVLKKHQIRRS